jgi:hypothetical protein
MKLSETFKELTTALSKFQSEVTNPTLNKENPHFKSRYADLSEVLNVVRPILTKHGLSIYQDVSSAEDKVVVTTTIFHESGEYLESNPLSIPAGRGGKPADAQGIGGAASYGKRYQLQAVLGITADEEDDGEGLADRGGYQAPKTSKLLNTPTQATLAAKYQLVMGSREGFDEYCKKLHDQGKDDAYIVQALDKAQVMKKQQESAK